MSLGIVCFSLIALVVLSAILFVYLDNKSQVPSNTALDRALSTKRYDESFVFNVGRARIRFPKPRTKEFVRQWTSQGNTIQS